MLETCSYPSFLVTDLISGATLSATTLSTVYFGSPEGHHTVSARVPELLLLISLDKIKPIFMYLY